MNIDLCPGLQYPYKFDGAEKNPTQQFSLEALQEAKKNGCLGYCLNYNPLILKETELLSQENSIPVFSPGVMITRNTYCLCTELVMLRRHKFNSSHGHVLLQKSRTKEILFCIEIAEEALDFI